MEFQPGMTSPFLTVEILGAKKLIEHGFSSFLVMLESVGKLSQKN